MPKTIVVSNRLPITVSQQESGLEITTSIGGLATGLADVFQKDEGLWIGWPGIESEAVPETERATLDAKLALENRYIPVHLTRTELADYYEGFSNRTIWPLFHYFPAFTEYDTRTWEAYQTINARFFQAVKKHLVPGDRVWIHDYQLMLLPKFVKDSFPDTKVGFFLHIPFPSFEIFRLLPWRADLLRGIAGADLVGFHTYDYVRHFLDCVRAILGIEHTMGTFVSDSRVTKADSFPMGIDFQKYTGALQLKPVKEAMKRIRKELTTERTLLSIDRLDFSKGIPQRLSAYELLLQKYPEFKEKISFILIVAPSRVQVPQYQDLKKKIDELVSGINSRHGTIRWQPIKYFFRSVAFDELAALYGCAHVMVVTPLRDGMNLIAKEYVATRSDRKGVLILSETAGTARELGESLVVNPNNTSEICDAMMTALRMPESEQLDRNTIMRKRIERYDVQRWVADFFEKLDLVARSQTQYLVTRLSAQDRAAMLVQYRQSSSRLLVLDYDGTLVSFQDRPSRALPDVAVVKLIEKLAQRPGTSLVIASGRDRRELDAWFGSLPVSLIAGHGAHTRIAGGEWSAAESVSPEWKDSIRPVLERFIDRTPGTLLEEKEQSLAWHYRKAEPELAAVRLGELKAAMLGLTENLHLGFLTGNKVLEIKSIAVNKGKGLAPFLSDHAWDFILAAGDDHTDEEVFRILPPTAWSIKVGFEPSLARFGVDSPNAVRMLLTELSETV